MKFLVSSFLFLALMSQLFSQVVTTEPSYPSENEALTIFFHSDKGTGGLKDYQGDVYAHTGVITSKSSGDSDWKYVKADWDENISDCKLTRLEQNLYKLVISPNLRAFYNVPDGEEVLKLAFVFRSADQSKEGKDDGGKDILIELQGEGLNARFITPTSNPTVVDVNETIEISGVVSMSSFIVIKTNGKSNYTSGGNSFSYTQKFSTPGLFTIVLSASASGETFKDSIQILVRSNVLDEPLPDGLEDGINYVSDTEVSLVLHAPGKQNVFVIGDFNNWTPSNEYQLKRDGERWWITLSNLNTDTPYAYQYLIDGSLKIADPYTELVLDPWNDKYITADVYPNLKAYPEGKTDGLVSVLEIKTEEFPWREKAFEAPAKEELVIYELLIRDFVSSHKVSDVKEKLDYLESLGVNAIELLPFNEFEGNSSWGYNPSFYFAPDKYYGTGDNLKEFIDECHVRGIAVIMDLVLNHSFSQSPLVQMYLGQDGKVTEDNPWYNVDSPNPVYSWGYDFNHESKDTKYFIDRVIKFWLQEYQLDGFRFDFTKGFTNTPGDGWAYDAARISILSRIYFVMQSAKPASYMICEHLADNSEEKVLSSLGILLWGNMNYNYNEATMGYVENSDLRGTSYKNRGWSKPNLISYMESHDEERLMYKNKTYGNILGDYNIKQISTGIERNKLAATFFFAIPGPKMIWQFGELGYDFSIDYNGRVGEKPIRWDYNEDPLRTELRDHYAEMIKLKTTFDVFNTSNFSLKVNNTADKQILLQSDELDVTVIGNFGMEQVGVNPQFTKNGWWYDYFSGDSINVTSETSTVMLNAGEYRLYSSKKLYVNNLGTSLSKDVFQNDIDVFPNPVSDFLSIQTSTRLTSIRIYNLRGQLVSSYGNHMKQEAVDVSQLANGIYILQLQTQEGIISKRFIKH